MTSAFSEPEPADEIDELSRFSRPDMFGVRAIAEADR